ncbi:DUF202 domain-containing protein [Agreia sp.]|uniref:DUF202 domain-containing protein n=1 Tax=Agreia sp. TaxID=1872416 RepID=UPI0035BBEFCA
MTIGPADPGLQPERSELAWRRTALTIAVGSLISMRVLPITLGHPAWSLVGVAGLAFAVWPWTQARRRGQQMRDALRDRTATPVVGGGALLTMAFFAFTCGVVGTLYVVSVALGSASV